MSNVDDAAVRAALRRLARAAPQKVNRAVQIVAQSAAKAGREHGQRTFPTSGGRFLAGGIRAKRERDGVFLVGPAGRADATGIFPEHEDPTAIRARGKVKRLQYQGKLAVPVGLKRGARGKVRRTPADITGPGGKGFLSRSGRAIVERVGKRRFRVAYALVDSARTPGELDLVKTITDRVFERFPRAVDEVLG
jgi:hypothetical protein